MRTAVDSSVLLDVLVDDPRFSSRSERALRAASQEGVLVLCECTLAEIRPVLLAESIDEFLTDWGLEFEPCSLTSSLLAGEMYARYLRRRTQNRRGEARVLPDFLIGAHALVHADRLLARDRGYYRDYFEKLDLLTP